MNDKLYVGVGATIHHWSDRTPATVIQIFRDGKKIIIQEDDYTRIDSNGMSESQNYSYNKNLNGLIHEVTLRKDGRYKISKTNTIVSIGERNKYHDYSF